MDLAHLRTEIDRINDEMLDLFLERMKVVALVGEYKKARGLPVHVPERETQVIEKMRERAGAEMAPYAEAFFRTLMDLAKELEAE